MPPDETLRFYDDNAADYAAGTSSPAQRSLLQTFTDKLPPGAKILDLGSGSGHDALWLIKRGLDVTLLDGSAGLAEEAEKRTGQKVRVLRFEQIDDVEAFHGIWASASLHHVHSTALPDVMARIRDALMPSALVFASFKQAEADWHDRMGRYFCAMSRVRLRTLAEDAGLLVDEIERSEGRGYDGEDTIWLSLMARKKP